jgi:hypothetical protein
VRRFRKHVVGGGDTSRSQSYIVWHESDVTLSWGCYRLRLVVWGCRVQKLCCFLVFSKVVIPKRLVDDIQKNKAFLVSQIVK